MVPRAGQILISMLIVFAILGTLFGVVYITNSYPAVAATGGVILMIGFFTWIVWAILFSPPDPYDY